MEQNKPLFFGVSEEDIKQQEAAKQQEQERIATELEKQRVAAEQRAAAEKQKAREEKRKKDLRELFRKYCSQKKEYCRSKFGEFAIAAPFALWGTFNIVLLSIVFGTIDGETGKPVRDYRIISDAYIPRSDGYVWYARPEHNPEYVGKIHPNQTWYLNMAFLMLGVLGIIGNPKQRIQNHKFNRNIKNEKKAVEMMYDLHELEKQYNLDTATVKRLVHVVPEVISRMSKDDAKYFEMLMNYTFKIKDNETYRAMAVAILAGHLESHPTDFQKVLDAFRGGVPEELMKKYGHQR
ncbi:MAG: hypothetical protein J6S80_04765 [Alphaproteobacteria bacterium]|nr:hypothetical protein [Alphaproteobacteria bacterium]